MTPGGRLAAAIEVIADIETRRRPAADALKDWGLAHRFAGSKDRAAIGSFVFDALRRRMSAAWIMQAETPRAISLGSLRLAPLETAAIAALCSGEGHAPTPLEPGEAARLDAADLAQAPPHVAADMPEWLMASLTAALGEQGAVDEGRALATRAPLDLRTNTLKGSREKALAQLASLGAIATPFSPLGLRIAPPADGRLPSLAGEPAYAKGLVEIQDEGSQLAALLAAARPGEQVLDLCAGGGGKSLAFAAALDNRGQVYATDADARRLAGLYPRLTRSGARNVQIRTPRRGTDVLADLAGRCDLVFIDAPCTGTGAWRRNPDAKWRVRPTSLAQRVKEQDEILTAAPALLARTGRIVYVTCSLLREENEDRIAAFLGTHPDFESVTAADMTHDLPALARFASPIGAGLRLSPATSDTDGFYVATLRRR